MQPAEQASQQPASTYKLTLFASNKDNIGRVVEAYSPDDIVDSYRQPTVYTPQDGDPPMTADFLKNASRAVSAAVFRDDRRAKANVVNANVLFLDFDEVPDSLVAGQLAKWLRDEGWVFALHTSTGSQFKDNVNDGLKLRLVMPLSEAVSADDYRSVWAEVSSAIRENVGLSADTTKQGAESLMYLPVWLPINASKWLFWSHTVAEGGEPYFYWQVADAPAGGSTYEQHALQKLSEGVQKDATLVKYAYALGARGTCTSESDIAAEIARLWPLVSAALQRAGQLPGGAPVKDWDAAGRKFHQKFVRGVRARQAEESAAVDALKQERTRELQAMLADDSVRSLARTNKKNLPSDKRLAQRLGKLCAQVDEVSAQRARQAFEQAVGAMLASQAEFKKELSAAFAEGLENAEDLQTEAGRAALGITFLETKEGLPKPCSANIVEMLVKDPLVKQTFSRDVRSLDDRLRMRAADGSVEKVHLNLHQGFQWCREVLANKHKLRNLEVKHWSEAVKTVDLEQITSEYDAVREYLDELPVVSDLASARECVDTFLIRHAGVEDSAYTRASTRALFVGAVHAAMRPGDGADLMWIFVGSQGLGKTQLLRSLCAEQDWFSELSPRAVSARGNENDQGRKKYRVMSKNWIVEVPEVRFERDDAETWKEFISCHRAYARLTRRDNDSEMVRRCVFVATTNDSEVLKDATGNRRFLPMTFTRMVDQDAVKQERDDLWACAYALWRADHTKAALQLPEHLWEAARDEQKKHYTPSAWEVQLEAMTSGTLPWPECEGEHAAYSQILGVEDKWKNDTRGADSNSIPRILAPAQLRQMSISLKIPKTADLPAVMKKLGWKLVDSRQFRTSGSSKPFWVHPDYQKDLV